MKLGNPLKLGSLSSIMLGLVFVSAFVYWYFTDLEKRHIHLLMVFFSLAITIRAYQLYKKLSRQNGVELIGDR